MRGELCALDQGECGACTLGDQRESKMQKSNSCRRYEGNAPIDL